VLLAAASSVAFAAAAAAAALRISCCWNLPSIEETFMRGVALLLISDVDLRLLVLEGTPEERLPTGAAAAAAAGAAVATAAAAAAAGGGGGGGAALPVTPAVAPAPSSTAAVVVGGAAAAAAAARSWSPEAPLLLALLLQLSSLPLLIVLSDGNPKL
jgi:hypothetical protein